MSSHSKFVSSNSPISEINELLENIPPPPEKAPYPPKIILYINVIQGRNLQSKGCYCCLQIGNKIVETSKDDNSYDPVWNEQFRFRKIDFSDQLSIYLYDKNSDKIGNINFPLVDFNVNQIVDQWYPIGNKDDKKSSQIRIAFHLATRYDNAFQDYTIKLETEDHDT